MFCKYCGNELRDDSEFCSNCGKKLVVDEKELSDDKVIDNTITEKSDDNKTNKKKIIIPIILVLSILGIGFIIINFVVLGVTQNKSKCELGEQLTNYEIIKPYFDSAQISFDEEVLFTEIGKQEISYTIKNGIFKKKGKITIEVIDTKEPILNGPEKVVIEVDSEFDLKEIYTVEDNDTNINISFSDDIDFSIEGNYSTVVVASDTAGNEATMDVEVEVIKLTDDEITVKKVIDYCIANNKTSKLDGGVFLYKTTSTAENDVAYYVMVGTYPNDELYAINNSGSVYEYTLLDVGDAVVYEYLKYAIILDGKYVSIDRIYKK